jgi:hypothetical protein
MALTPIDKFEVMYSANTFPPRIWLMSGKSGQMMLDSGGQDLPE